MAADFPTSSVFFSIPTQNHACPRNKTLALSSPLLHHQCPLWLSSSWSLTPGLSKQGFWSLQLHPPPPSPKALSITPTPSPTSSKASSRGVSVSDIPKSALQSSRTPTQHVHQPEHWPVPLGTSPASPACKIIQLDLYNKVRAPGLCLLLYSRGNTNECQQKQ